MELHEENIHRNHHLESGGGGWGGGDGGYTYLVYFGGPAVVGHSYVRVVVQQ